MLQYPRTLHFDDDDDDQEASTTGDSPSSLKAKSTKSSSSDEDDDINFIDAAMTAFSMGTGDMATLLASSPATTPSPPATPVMRNTSSAGESRIRQSLAIVETTAEVNARQLSHIQHVMRLSKVSCQRMEDEGIESVQDLYVIEDLLRKGSVRGLKSVETGKLLQFLGWAQWYQSVNDDVPDVEQNFTRLTYQSYCKRQQQQQQQHLREGGLESSSADSHDTSSSATATWPFQLNLPPRTNILQFPLRYVPDDDDTTTSGSNNSSRRTNTIHQIFVMAELDLEMFQSAAGTPLDLHRAMDKFRTIIEQTTPHANNTNNNNNTMLQAFARIKLSILYHRIEFQDLPMALQLMEHAALVHKVPTALFFYGYAVATGRGLQKKNTARGMALLQQAAAAHVGEASFVMAYLQEQQQQQHIHAARLLYLRAAYVLAHTEYHGWRGMVAGVSAFSRQWQQNDSITVGPILEHFHDPLWLESSSGGALSLGLFVFVGQTILLVAAAILSRQVQLDHYPILILLVPILGCLVSLATILQLVGSQAACRPLRMELAELQKAKLEAYRHLLGMKDNDQCLERASSSVIALWIVLWYYYLTYTITRATPPSPVQSRILWIEARLHVQQSQSSVAAGFFMAVILLLVWIVLLGQEIASYGSDCSQWFASVCELPSDAVCERASVCQSASSESALSAHV